MGHPVRAIASLGILSVLTVGVSASPGPSGPDQIAVTEKPPLMPTHAIRGVVKSMSESALVITPSRKKTGDMTFVLSPATYREGGVTVGAMVSIRYRVMEGHALLATAVSSHPETRAAPR